MPSPFPGMDPYLEHPTLWHPFHTRLLTTLADLIDPVLPGGYYVSVEERTSIRAVAHPPEVRLPDVAVVAARRSIPVTASASVAAAAADAPAELEVWVPAPDVAPERYLEIRAAESQEEVVTVLEVLSPSNKRPGERRDDYLVKRGILLASTASLIEIDVLRAGPRMPALGAPEGFAYSILTARAATRPRASLHAFGVRDPLRPLAIPLRRGEAEPNVSLADAVSHVYDRGRYRLRIDYSGPPEPPLAPDDEAWADRLLREHGLR